VTAATAAAAKPPHHPKAGKSGSEASRWRKRSDGGDVDLESGGAAPL